jgi:hypothetical protein
MTRGARIASALAIAALAAGAGILLLRPAPTESTEPSGPMVIKGTGAPNYSSGPVDGDLQFTLSATEKEEAPGPVGATFRGRVLTVDGGAPVEGALVLLDLLHREATTGPDGSFAIAGLPAGRSDVRILPKGQAPLLVYDLDFPGRGSVERDFYVEEGAAVEIKVTFEGKVVVGAQVSVESANKSALTGAEGTAHLSGFPPETYIATVKAQGFIGQGTDFEVPPGVARVAVEVALRREWRVRGRVLLEGVPVAGARVGGSEGSDLFRTSWSGPVSADDGTYTLEGAGPAFAARVVAWKPGAGVGVSRTLEFREGAVHEGADIALVGPVEVRGTVVMPSGAPASGASVEAICTGLWTDTDLVAPRPTDERRTAKADAEGRFSLSLQRGSWILGARASGDFTAWSPQLVTAPVIDGKLTIVLREPRTFRGRALDEEGNPVAGARIWFRGADSVPAEGVRTEGDGGFRITVLAGPGSEMVADHDGFLRATSNVFDAGKPVEIRMVREGRVAGMVLLPDGRTPARVGELRVYRERDAAGEPADGGNWPERTELFSDRDGRFSMGGLEAGTVAVEAACGDLLAQARGIRVVPGKEPVPIRLVLARGAVIRGTLRDGKGDPVAGADVVLRAPHTGLDSLEEPEGWDVVRETACDVAGKFEFRTLPGGRYFVGASREGFFDAQRTVLCDPGAEAVVDLVLARGGHLALRCGDVEGNPIEKFTLQFRDDAGNPVTVDCVDLGDTAASTEFTSSALSGGVRFPAGAYRACVAAAGYVETPVAFALREGETTELTVVLKR